MHSLKYLRETNRRRERAVMYLAEIAKNGQPFAHQQVAYAQLLLVVV